MTDAPKPLGLSDFFALEAGEYLERLDALLGRPDAATLGEEFVRLARALRGSALMANHHGIARAAQGLEQLARAVRAGHRPWDEGTRQAGIRAVDDLKVLLRRASEWSDADTARAEALGVELERLAGPAAAPAPAAAPRALDAGARAFVAREGAAIASALDRAAGALRQNPRAHDHLQHVLRAIQPLRGLAALADLPPLADLLEGIERAIAELGRSKGDPPTSTADVFGAAAQAIAHAARGVAEHGKPEPESAEFQRFTSLLVAFLDGGPDVVSIASLYYQDAGPHIVERGAGVPGAPLGRVELVTHGENG
jgi:chemotaxis protein histidine kinase CheA